MLLPYIFKSHSSSTFLTSSKVVLSHLDLKIKDIKGRLVFLYLNLCQGDGKVGFSFCLNGISHEGDAALVHMCLRACPTILCHATLAKGNCPLKGAVRRAQEDTFALILKFSST